MRGMSALPPKADIASLPLTSTRPSALRMAGVANRLGHRRHVKLAVVEQREFNLSLCRKRPAGQNVICWRPPTMA